MFWYDWQYILYVFIPGLIVVTWAQIRVKSAFSKYTNVINTSGLTGRAAAEQVLRQNGITDVNIVRINGEMTDYYDPTKKIIALSESVYDSSTIAAVGIASHEAGHAVQHAEGYAPIKVRKAILPVCNFGASFGPIIAVVGLIMNSISIAWAGIILFSFVVIFQLITLPVEFNASSRALQAISSYGMLNPSEKDGAKKMLTAAAMTYVAQMFQSMLILLYYIARINGNSRR